MTDLAVQHVAASKRLFMSVAAAVGIMDTELPAIYVSLGLGQGFFRRGMSKEVSTDFRRGITVTRI